MIHLGDCLVVMRTMPSESVDAIVTDPPAGISFMSKNWDHDKGGRTQWVAWMTEVMVECHRLLKPGGYAVVWSLPRTCHWTAWAMEDAGFIIRDQLAHIFASGFPKGKAQLKPAREDWWLARKPGPLRPLNIEECRISAPENVGRVWTRGGNQQGASLTTNTTGEHQYVEASAAGRWPSNLLLSDPELFDEPNPWVVGSGATSTDGTAVNRNRDGNKPSAVYEPFGTDQPDSGYGGGGGYSRFFRIPSEREPNRRRSATAETAPNSTGSAPDESVAGYPSTFIVPKSDRRDREPIGYNGETRLNVHPTCKPTDLMRHLIRLVTPPGGTVLDPFLGSGSTAIAAELEGFPWIGIEKEPEYVAIAEARLNGTQRGLGLDVPAPTKRQAKPAEYTGERHPGREWTKWREEGQRQGDEEPAA